MTQSTPARSIADEVPESEVVEVFGGMLAVSPEIFQKILQSMADRHGVDKDELSVYVMEVLRRQPPYED